jgi:aspartyl/asparaginyl beta-hydroxylase (cupin superfamily)
MSESQFVWPEGEEIVYLRPPNEEYHGKLKPFYKVEAFPELQPLIDNWEGIRDEILAFEKKHGHLNIMNSLSPAQVEGAGKWNLTYLVSFRWMFHENISYFPFTWSVIQQVPSCVFAGISILPPHTEIKPHFGDTNGIVRAHLGLIVPAPYPEIAIHVGEEEQGWEDGKMLCFMNIIKHWVWNKTDHRRYVLMFDFVPKPLIHRTNEICSRALGSQSFIFFYKRWSWVRALPEFTHGIFCYLFSLVWRIYLPIQNKFKFL